MTPPLCFQCKWFKQYQPLHFRTPGVCKWEPANQQPPWFDLWWGSDDRYHGPAREVSTFDPIKECNAFEEKSDDS